MAAPLESPRMQGLCGLAKELGVWLSLGGYHEKVRLNSYQIYVEFGMLYLFRICPTNLPKVLRSAISS